MMLSSLALALPFVGSEGLSSDWAQLLGLAAVGLAVIAAAAAAGAVFGGAIWLFSERRLRNLLGFVAIAAGCGAAAAIAVGREMAAQQYQAQVNQRHQQQVEAMRAEQERRDREWEAQQKALEEMRKNPIVAAAQRLRPEERDQLKAIEDELIAELRRLNEQFEASLEEIGGAGVAWMQPHDLKGYEQLREQYRALRDQSEALADYVYQFGATYQERLDALELSPEAEKVGLAQKESILQSPFFQQYQQLRADDAELLALVLDYLDLLVQYPNQWEYNPQTKQLEIENERFSAELDHVVSQIAAKVQQGQPVK